MSKTFDGETTHYVFDLSGKLIAETKADGTLIREYIYLGSQPIALITQAGDPASQHTYFTHNDHLGTPRILTNASQDKVWEIHTTPFGEIHQEIASGVEQLLAFPGQYRDGETGYSYNYYRDYDPSLGRYIQSDPIGLEGGLNTYGYVGGNPAGFSDFYGLRATTTLFTVPTAPFRPGTLPNSPSLMPASEVIVFQRPIEFMMEPHEYPYLPPFVYPENTVTRNGVDYDYDGNPTSCPVNNKDKCQDILNKIYSIVYQKRSTSGSNQSGIAQRYMTQLQDPGNLYNDDRKDWDRHNDQIRQNQRQLKKKIDEARKMGCSIPPEIFYWLNIAPPRKPW